MKKCLTQLTKKRSQMSKLNVSYSTIMYKIFAKY